MPSEATEQSVIVILGPTASGKSALALSVARKIGAEIISADSRQIYRELDIGSAKPSRDVLREVKHHFIDEKSIGEPFTAGDFAAEAVQRIQDIHKRGKEAIVAGGSTLYLEGLLEGFADLPAADPVIRQRLMEEMQREGKEALFERLRQLDPEQAATLDATKSHRLIRSLEIIEITGRPVTALQAENNKRQPSISYTSVALSMPRERLYERINRRTDEMIEAGLCNEAEMLYHRYHELLECGKTSALQSVGYQELFQYFQGKIALPAAITLIKQHSRNYAKRQLTFFKNRLNVNWITAPESNDELEVLANRLSGTR
ncbi:MAG: tRNA (adenosine(37)-N6)-dimethylallyltransferase MiaA [Chlorobiaceae bacterium]|nr:tRNA (adenosine(37)-N6)-dimethylallyltransferase MiaA [Chlorobiaceae bacterium]